MADPADQDSPSYNHKCPACKGKEQPPKDPCTLCTDGTYPGSKDDRDLQERLFDEKYG